MKKKIDYNSSENQEIKSRFVKREVLTCFSYEMDAILKASSTLNVRELDLPCWDDIENLYEKTCPQCGEVDNSVEDCPKCNCELEQEPQEIYEWWIVTDYLCDKLRKQGEAVLEWGNNCYWGRTTTGQSIMLDHVISVICEEMEILDGQKYSWAEVVK